MFQLKDDSKRITILNATGNLLVMGGPGSGKTTIALFKAKELVENGSLKEAQKILFLSFARATISRVEEQAGNLIPSNIKKSIEINTYHGFIWNILKRHGYLINSRAITLLPLHEAAVRFSGIEKSKLPAILDSTFEDEGLVHFDMFARLCNRLLSQSNALRRIISDVYPVIILDEFQDTNSDEWDLICTLGKDSCLLALADPEQRIYDFRGADPKRITDFIEQFKPTIVDFGTENNRSTGTDIVQYGNDLLAQNNHEKTYNNVIVQEYPSVVAALKHYHLKYVLLRERAKLIKASPDKGSIAILVPTNSLMLEVSDFLQKVQKVRSDHELPAVAHEVAIETAGPSLAALFVATLLSQGSIKECTATSLLTTLLSHILGRKGTHAPTKADTTYCDAIKRYLLSGKVSGKNRKALIEECQVLANTVNQIVFTGNIIADWKTAVDSIKSCSSIYLKQIASDVKYLRLLQKGSQLYVAFDSLWRQSYSYNGAVEAVSSALTQEHFSMSTKTWDGISIMTIHKAKGKEFDIVIIYEGRYQNRIVSRPDRIDQARLNLRVAVTRAKRKAIVLTPEEDPCPLL